MAVLSMCGQEFLALSLLHGIVSLSLMNLPSTCAPSQGLTHKVSALSV